MQTVMKAVHYLLHLANSFADYCEISTLKLGRPFFKKKSHLKRLVLQLDKHDMIWITYDLLIYTGLLLLHHHRLYQYHHHQRGKKDLMIMMFKSVKWHQ